MADSDWLVRAGLDKARISCRISASRCGGSGDTLINVIDAADLKLCLSLPSFLAEEGGNPDFVSTIGISGSRRSAVAAATG